jgi:hypothetical protein
MDFDDKVYKRDAAKIGIIARDGLPTVQSPFEYGNSYGSQKNGHW